MESTPMKGRRRDPDWAEGKLNCNVGSTKLSSTQQGGHSGVRRAYQSVSHEAEMTLSLYFLVIYSLGSLDHPGRGKVALCN